MRFLESRRAPVVVIVLALLLSAPSLKMGFCVDDAGFRAALAREGATRPAVYDLFRFAPGTPRAHQIQVAYGTLPWWTAPDFKLHLLRPLASLLFAADDALFGDRAILYHLHSLAWYALLLAAAALLFRRLLPPATATLALLVFAFRAAHMQPIAYVSARHILVAAAAVALGLALLAPAWDTGERPSIKRSLAATLAMILGLLASEAALAGPIFWAVAALLGSARPRLRAAIWPVVLAAAYLVAYRLLGGGALASGAYHDPLTAPGAFAAVAIERIPVLLGDALLGIPAELALAHPPLPFALAGLAAVLVAALLWAAIRNRVAPRERAALRWLVPAAALAVVVGVAGLPGGRVLTLPDLGFAALVAVLLRHGFTGAGPLRAVTTGILVLQHVIVAPIAGLLSMARFARVARGIDAVVATAELEAGPPRRVFVVAASDPAVFLYPRGVLAGEVPRRTRCFVTLSAARADHEVTAVDDHTLTIEPKGRTLLDGSFDTLFRASDRPFAAGDTVRSCGATIRVAAVEDGRPSRLEVDLGKTDDVTLLVWHEGRLRRFTPGPKVLVPWEQGPSRIF